LWNLGMICMRRRCPARSGGQHPGRGASSARIHPPLRWHRERTAGLCRGDRRA